MFRTAFLVVCLFYHKQQNSTTINPGFIAAALKPAFKYHFVYGFNKVI